MIFLVTDFCMHYKYVFMNNDNKIRKIVSHKYLHIFIRRTKKICGKNRLTETQVLNLCLSLPNTY